MTDTADTHLNPVSNSKESPSGIINLIDVEQEQVEAIVATGRFRVKTASHLWILAICTIVIALSFLMSTEGKERVLIPGLNLPLPELCFARRSLNIECPGCGLTRCFISISHGDLGRAWQFNPAGFLLYGLIALQIPYRLIQLWRLMRGYAALSVPHFEYFVWVLAAILAIQWIAKTTSIYL